MKNCKRNFIVCTICGKYKVHFGLQKCSACLRQYKRQTRKSFYLGTCYSEIKRRCTTKTKTRKQYFGKTFCTKEEFFNRFLTDNQFDALFKVWQKNNHQRKYAPSIDRIDNDKDYLIENLRFTTQYENSTKDRVIPIKINGKIIKSQKEAAKLLKMTPSRFCILKHKIPFIYKGDLIEYP